MGSGSVEPYILGQGVGGVGEGAWRRQADGGVGCPTLAPWVCAAARFPLRDSGNRPEVKDRFVDRLSGGGGWAGYTDIDIDVCDEPVDDSWEETDEGEREDEECGERSLSLLL